MSTIQPIKNSKGELIAYQVRSGTTDRKGIWQKTRYVSLRQFPTDKLAYEAAEVIRAEFDSEVTNYGSTKTKDGMTSRNTSGVPGIAFRIKVNCRNTELYSEVISVSYRVNGVHKMTCYSTNKHGMDQAILLAMKKRGIPVEKLSGVRHALGFHR